MPVNHFLEFFEFLIKLDQQLRPGVHLLPLKQLLQLLHLFQVIIDRSLIEEDTLLQQLTSRPGSIGYCEQCRSGCGVIFPGMFECF